MFTGTVRIKICEACGLRPTDFQRRHNMTFGKPDEQLIDPYVSIDVDENHLGKFDIIIFISILIILLAIIIPSKEIAQHSRMNLLKEKKQQMSEIEKKRECLYCNAIFHTHTPCFL